MLISGWCFPIILVNYDFSPASPLTLRFSFSGLNDALHFHSYIILAGANKDPRFLNICKNVPCRSFQEENTFKITSRKKKKLSKAKIIFSLFIKIILHWLSCLFRREPKGSLSFLFFYFFLSFLIFFKEARNNLRVF